MSAKQTTLISLQFCELQFDLMGANRTTLHMVFDPEVCIFIFNAVNYAYFVVPLLQGLQVPLLMCIVLTS